MQLFQKRFSYDGGNVHDNVERCINCTDNVWMMAVDIAWLNNGASALGKEKLEWR